MTVGSVEDHLVADYVKRRLYSCSFFLNPSSNLSLHCETLLLEPP